MKIACICWIESTHLIEMLGYARFVILAASAGRLTDWLALLVDAAIAS